MIKFKVRSVGRAVLQPNRCQTKRKICTQGPTCTDNRKVCREPHLHTKKCPVATEAEGEDAMDLPLQPLGGRSPDVTSSLQNLRGSKVSIFRLPIDGTLLPQP